MPILIRQRTRQPRSTSNPPIRAAPAAQLELIVCPGEEPSKLTYSYQWRANGKSIAGATSSSYVPIVSDEGKDLSVRVTGSLTGQSSVSMSIGVVQVTPKPAAKATQQQIEDRVFILVNKERTSRGLHALTNSNLYQLRKSDWTQYLVDNGKYEHSEYNWYAEDGRRSMGLYGENLGVSARTTLQATDDLVKSWMNSLNTRAHSLILKSHQDQLVHGASASRSSESCFPIGGLALPDRAIRH
ncbi:hypothetical protein ACXR2T_15770 [Leucobacter sp. HY1910]